ncbi:MULTISPECIES: nitroreductase family deazaflavin-dependent oxidoreductase [Actinomycetes]|uniref:Nitroreductase family deazaflavin-dependent oxidoreductase n=1 Tax=Williamsia marianensis TaxID=85044 RepID=A0ABU4ETH6_WILMA|nr:MULTISPECIES: nitroreductase family deazaflavin-dependent oxidoreductase [Actinomycetes]MDV7134559.1 nitroreductase family deazaflavin-dependent oxidoreductase [Williamsia muralis]
MANVDELHGEAHVQRYLETNGEEGFHWKGTEILILFTKGRKSGDERRHALIFRTWEDNAYLVVASKGGADAPPAWFLNLQDNPEAEIQVKDERIAVRARVANDEEKPAMWSRMVEVWPDYDDYQTKTSRPIPVVVLERV